MRGRWHVRLRALCFCSISALWSPTVVNIVAAACCLAGAAFPSGAVGVDIVGAPVIAVVTVNVVMPFQAVSVRAHLRTRV